MSTEAEIIESLIRAEKKAARLEAQANVFLRWLEACDGLADYEQPDFDAVFGMAKALFGAGEVDVIGEVEDLTE